MPDKKITMRFAEKILNVPLLLSVSAAETLISMIKGGIEIGASPVVLPEEVRPQTFQKQTLSSSDEIVAVIPVHGFINQHADEWAEYYWDETSYETIGRLLREALQDTAVKAIVFDIDSQGGLVAGCMDLVDDIYNARSIKPIYAVLNNTAYSGAYAIASAAEKIFIPRDGGAGSVGVIAVHIDRSGMDEQIGLKFTSIYAGARKNDFNPHEPLTDEARRLGQQSVDESYDVFAKTVARNRGMTVQAVKATEAAIYRGQKAVDIGFADAVISPARAINQILKQNSSKKGGTSMNLWEKIKALFTEEKATAEATVEAMKQLGYVPASTMPDVEKIKTEAHAAGKLAGIKEGMDRAALIIETCDLAKMGTMALGFIKEGLAQEAVQTKLLDKKAEADRTRTTMSTTSANGSGDVNYLLEGAKQLRAQAEKTMQK